MREEGERKKGIISEGDGRQIKIQKREGKEEKMRVRNERSDGR